ncbi:MAG: DUF4192 domain-containing protein, partial [Stackebrandtia sp.]
MKTSVETTPDITLESPAELLSAVPYLVGYVPAESMVVIGLTDKQIGLTACTPLPSADEPPGRIGVTAQVLRRNDVQAAVIVGYGPRERVARSVDYMRGVLDEAGVDLVEAMRVAGGRYWSFTCPGANCCPAEGLPLHPERATAVDAAFAVGGAQALPSRDAMLDRLSPVAGAARAAAIKAIRRAEKEQG